MKKVLIFLFWIPVLLSGMQPLSAQSVREEKLNHELKAVRVYFSRAELTHEARVNLPAGNYSLVFSGLSQYLDESSLQVSGEGDGIIQGVSARTSYLNRTNKPERVRVLEDSLTIIGLKSSELNDFIFVLDNERGLILNNNKVAGEEKGLSTEELQKLAEFYRTRLRTIQAEMLIHRENLKKNEDRKKKILNELNEFSRERDQPTKEVVVTFMKKGNAAINLKLKYLTKNATWRAGYDLRCTKINEPVNLILKGKIVNRTGIEWKNVQVSLSTADPNSYAVSPTLDPLYLYIRQPIAVQGKGKAMYQNAPQEVQDKNISYERDEASEESEGSDEDSWDQDGADDAAPPAPSSRVFDSDVLSSSSYTGVKSRSLATEYTIDLPYTIPSDGKEVGVEVKKIEMPGNFRYFAVPKKSKDAYLQLELTDWNTYDLIAGEASVYFEGNFVSKTNIDPTSADDTLYVNMGKDPKVVIERKLDKKYSSQKSLGSQVKLERTFKITVKNNKAEPINLLIEDQVPVSSGNQIEVIFIGAKGADYDTNSGKLKWELQLESGRSRVLEINYDIKFPKGMVLYSGDGGADY